MTESRSTEETISIETAGESVAVRTLGASVVTVVIEGDAAADYAWDVRRRGGSWKQEIGDSYTGETDYDDVRETGADEVRIRCTSGTAGPTDEATITLMAN